MKIVDMEEDKCHEIVDFGGFHYEFFMERSFGKF
jgi:hypothetical protein